MTATARRGWAWLGGVLGLALAPGCSQGADPTPRDCRPNLYYCGPTTAHFDGRLFVNPDGEQGTGGQQHEGFAGFVKQGLGQGASHTWPKNVPVTPSKPPARVEGERMLVTWIGHSTVLIQTRSLNILLDPVWAERDSPVPFAGPKRVRRPGVRFRDLPKIDLVLISHDHFDHLDAGTVKMLWKRDRPRIVAGLGTDALMKPYGVPIIARDWGQAVQITPELTVTLRRAHHWSAHSLNDKNMALWTGFTLALPGGDIYYAGDTGAGDMRWAPEALTARPIRFAILPIGAIKVGGPPSGNHIGPAEAVTAFGQLRVAYALGVHWGTFELTSEPIDAPPQLLAKALADKAIPADRFRVLEAGGTWEIPSLTIPAA